ncbi:MAG: hypothetical protein NTV43_11790 [Methylococcales bacterium]|nr:hypothetical protein [Methylococcales bacterium]
MAFDREISDEMINALNKQYEDENSWWRKLADHDDTLIAIREKYLNVYFNGCNVAKVELKNKKLKASIHYKYLLKNKIKSPYIEQIDKEFKITKHADLFITSLLDFKDILGATKAYGGIEKIGVHKIIRANQNIIDTEIAFSGAKSDEDDDSGKKNSRIDFCAIQKEDGKLLLRFFEAKIYSNKELKAEPSRKIKVISQLNRYHHILENQNADILSAYKKLIRNAADIKGKNILGNILENYPDINTLKIDPVPRLVIFGYDDDQKKGENFKKHMDALRAELGKSRLLLKGDPKGFKAGISS